VVVRGRGTRGACHLQQRQEHRERIERIGAPTRSPLTVRVCSCLRPNCGIAAGWRTTSAAPSSRRQTTRHD
jgi:hypothetical protein